MKTSGLVAVLAGASAVEAFLPSPSASLGLRQSRTSCVSKAPVGRQSRAQQHYMVAAPAKEEGTVAAVPHGGTLVDLNLKTDEEKKVRDPLHAFRGMSGGRNFDHVHTTILRLQPGFSVRTKARTHRSRRYQREGEVGKPFGFEWENQLPACRVF